LGKPKNLTILPLHRLLVQKKMVQQSGQRNVHPAQKGYMGMGMHKKPVIDGYWGNYKSPQYNTKQGGQ
jgi:hypothetical protein